MRAPKIGKTLPRPLPVAAARRIADSELHADENAEPWIYARDAAVLALLYGSGLRISEALGLSRRLRRGVPRGGPRRLHHRPSSAFSER